MRTHRRGVTVVVGAAATLVLTASMALAVLMNFSGTSVKAMRAVTSTDPAATNSANVWVNVPGAVLTVPAGTGATLLARFSGESRCANLDGGGAINFCRTRIVLTPAGGAPVEFHPQSNLDYVWDNTVDGRAPESHAMERLYRVSAGDWTIRVQFNTSNAGTQLTLDDWTFVVEAFNP